MGGHGRGGDGWRIVWSAWWIGSFSERVRSQCRLAVVEITSADRNRGHNLVYR